MLGGSGASNAGTLEIIRGRAGFNHRGVINYNPEFYSPAERIWKLPPPIISLPAGSPYAPGPVTVTLTANDAENIPGQIIRYTLDGSAPSGDSTVYSGPFQVAANVTVRAISTVSTGWYDSDSSTAPVIYRSPLLPPTATASRSPDLSPYWSGPFNLTLSHPNAGVSGVEIRYTVDQSTPTPTSLLYTGPISVTGPTVVKAICVAPQQFPSSVYAGGFYFKAVAPTLNPPSGHLGESGYKVTASSPTPSVEFYYTTNGTDPVPGASLKFDALKQITVTQDQTIRVIASRAGWVPSDVVAANYRVLAGDVVFDPPSDGPKGLLQPKNRAYRVTMSCPPGRTIWYTKRESGDAEPPSPIDANGKPIQEAIRYTEGSPVPVLRSPTKMKAVCLADGVQPGRVSTGQWWTRGADAKMGEAINRPLNADITPTKPPLLILQAGGLDETISGTSPDYEEQKLADWSPFAFIANAPDPFSPNPSQPRVGVVYGAADNKPGKIHWWIPEFNSHVEFDHESLPPNPDDVVQTYHTDSAPPVMQVQLPLGNVISRIHYNNNVARKKTIQAGSPVSNYLWISPNTTEKRSLNAARRTGFVLMEFQDNVSGPFGGVQVVELKPYAEDPSPNIASVPIGTELRPKNTKTRMARPWVTVGLGATGVPDFIYQHNRLGPFDGRVFSVRKTVGYTQMEVVWTQRDRLNYGTVWPYEIRRYASDWPTNPQKYVIARPNAGEPSGPLVRLPSPRPAVSGLSSELMDFQVQDDGSATKHASIINNEYGATKPGKAIIKYSVPSDRNSNDWIGFHVIQSVWRDDPSFNLTQIESKIGLEIKGPERAPGESHHQAPWPGHLHVYGDYGDEYHPAIYGHDPTKVRSLNITEREAQFNKGQIFPVNVGKFEVWWYNKFSPPEWHDGMAVYWPSTVTRHNNQWPTSPAVVDIADQCGTGALSGEFRRWSIYWQNNPAAPGFNPNDEHAIRWPVQNGEGAFALRNDLGSAATSDPWLILPYQVGDPLDSDWNMLVYKVTAGNFNYLGKAGTRVQPPNPLNSFTDLKRSYHVSGPVWRDRKDELWAYAAGDAGRDATAAVTMRYFYADRPDQGFYYPVGYSSPPAGGPVPWLDRLARSRNAAHPVGEPIDISYVVRWPDGAVPTGLQAACDSNTVQPETVPVMLLGESLVMAKRGLPAIAGQKSVDILYQQSVANGQGRAVDIIDPTRKYFVNGVQNLPSDIKKIPYQGKVFFEKLPPHLQQRFWFEDLNDRLVFEGRFVDSILGEDYLQLNVVSQRDRAHFLSLSGDGAFIGKLNALFTAAANPIILHPDAGTEVDSMALTSGNAQGSGYVTLAFSANPGRAEPDDPISLEIIRVEPPLHPGELKLIYPPSPFDEAITLRHSCDFLGKPEDFEFEYRFRPDPLPSEIASALNQWPANYNASHWTTYPLGSGESALGRQEIVIRGASINTLTDNWFICRYRPKNAAHPLLDQWSPWTRPQLAEGWIKRVLAGLKPFEQRYGSRPVNSVNTMVSMISQAGRQWEGQVPFVASPEDIDRYGLIEIYESVLHRGIDLSVNGTPPIDFAPANNALMLVAGRLSDLYMLIGNEAYADAIDPTIAFGTSDGQFGAQASSLFCFKNQFADLLGEELGLLRGRDDSALPGTRVAPVYNRLIWNLTRGMTGGEVAYVLNYAIRDGNWNRIIAGDSAYNTLVDDAARAYPQGHGDAWGHYLSALKAYQKLMANPNFTWVPTAESVIVAGQPVTVDYYDERKFASTAAAKARTGAEILNLTYREKYSEDSAELRAGFTDAKSDRAWGINDWAMRAGQGAYVDWVVGNAVLPDVDPDASHTGVRKVDRTTVLELGNIPSAYNEIQSQLDAAGSGLNPLGVAQNAVPFDISPAELGGTAPKSHFEQIYGRAVDAMNNAISVFNHAFNSAQRLRAQADDVANFQDTVEERKADFRNRLIEIFGYPYADDIGNGKTYPDGYDGPDLYHFMYFDPSELIGRRAGSTREVDLQMLTRQLKKSFDGAIPSQVSVKFNFSTEGFGLVRPTSWTRPRRSQGEIQMAHSEIMQAWGRMQRAAREYANVIDQIDDQRAVLAAQDRLTRARLGAGAAEAAILRTTRRTQQSLNSFIAEARAKQIELENKASDAVLIAQASANAISTMAPIFGLANSPGDILGPLRQAIELAGSVVARGFRHEAQDQARIELDMNQAKEDAQSDANIRIVEIRNGIIDEEGAVAKAGTVAELNRLVRSLAVLKLDIYALDSALEQAANKYLSVLSRGQRVMEEQDRFFAKTAAEVQQYRYKDMAFRVFRDDALQKYRAQFDLASRYVYLAAKAYDYETGLLDSDSRATQSFFKQIVKARSIGTIVNGQPMTGGSSGDAGLADPMARMAQSWVVLKPRLGFNNPATSSFKFSLRHGNYRIVSGAQGNQAWREMLQNSRVDNMLDHEEFRRFCIPPQGSGSTAEPAIILPFTTSINSGRNFFGWPLGGGDMAYPSTHFAVKIKAAGVCLENYNASIQSGLSATPYVYLVPAGLDRQRVPTDQLSLRSWQVLDQIIPTPFVLGQTDLNNPDYVPQVDSLGIGGAAFGNIRRFPEMLACHNGAGGEFDPNSPNVRNSRLVGRSVWNSRWLLIIPGRTLNGSDPHAGLEQFINGRLVGGVRDGNGVTDIRLLFDAYSYSGN